MIRSKPDPLDPSDQRKPVCPECDGSTIKYRTGRQSGGRPGWLCSLCGATFTRPAYRVTEPMTSVDRPYISAAGRAAIEWEPESAEE